MSNIKPLPCKCGSAARIRYKDPYVWVECKKKCGMKTGSYLVFVKETSERDAIVKWNDMVSQNDDITKL